MDTLNKPRVFLVEPNDRYDLSALDTFGSVAYVCASPINAFSTNNAVRIIKDSLQKQGFDPATDFICMTGHAIKVAVLLSVTASEYGPLRLLMFDATKSNYRERRFDLSVERV